MSSSHLLSRSSLGYSPKATTFRLHSGHPLRRLIKFHHMFECFDWPIVARLHQRACLAQVGTMFQLGPHRTGLWQHYESHCVVTLLRNNVYLDCTAHVYGDA